MRWIKKRKNLLPLRLVLQRDGCIGFHAKALVHLGATREEIEEVCGRFAYMARPIIYVRRRCLCLTNLANNLNKKGPRISPSLLCSALITVFFEHCGPSSAASTSALIFSHHQ